MIATIIRTFIKIIPGLFNILTAFQLNNSITV